MEAWMGDPLMRFWFPGGLMITEVSETTDVSAEPLELLRTMLEERFAVHTTRLTQLTVYRRLPRHGGYDAHTLDVLAASARQGIAETAHALRRMSEGTYGVCGGCRNPIPLGRLRVVPHATHCVPCDRKR
jgi:DnaK suppressor protein